MEYYENGGGALAKLAWSADFVPKDYIPQTQLYPFSLPAITNQPVSRNAAVGTSATFAVSANGSAPLSYRWRFNGLSVSNAIATNTTLLLTNVQLSASGGYSVIVSNPVGSVTSTVATLTVGYPVQITSQLQDQTVVQGDTVTLKVGVSGDGPIFYRWYREGGVIINFSNGLSSVIITNVQMVNTGKYQVLITNLFLPAGIRSSNALLTVLADINTNHIADDWETRFGFSLSDPGVATADPDLDGMSNYQEFIAGTDPTNGLSYLHIDALGTVPGGAVLNFLAISNKTYTVFYRDALGSASWQPLTNLTQSAPTNRLITLTNGAPVLGQRYYRLATPGQ